MDENLKNQLDQFNEAIDSKIEKSNNNAIDAVVVKASEIAKNEVTELGNKNKERLDARTKAWDEGEWVRDAAMAYAEKQTALV